jgi:hypothetical protein
MNDENTNRDVDLRPVIARLREIEKKCGSMGSRNEEFPLMQERLNSIIKRLEAGEEPSGEALAYRAIARELFPIAHLFESVGFMSVGKEIIHVEKTLQELAPEAPVPDAHTAGGAVQRTESQPPAAADRAGVTQETDGEGADRYVPWPIIGGLVVLLVATMIAAMMILEVGPFRVEPTVHGDHVGAIDHLSAAALIDRDNTGVLEIADELVGVLVNDANAAAADARWEDAAQILERASRVAMRFGLTTSSIDRATRRLAAMERYVIVGPDDTRAIRGSTGRRVELRMKDGSQRTGRIEGVAGTDFLLEVESDVGGGIVSYTDKVP